MTIAYTSGDGNLAVGRTYLTSPSQISARMERLPATKYLWMLVALIYLGGFFEMYELFFTAYIKPGLIKSGILISTTQSFFGFSGIGAFIAATFAGLFIGTFFLGFLPDRYNTLSYAYHAYQAEVFPVRIRGRAAGITYSASRVGAMSSGFLIAFFLKEYGVNGVFALITGAMIVVMASIGIFGPRIKDLEHEVEAH
jgi:MFS family permease